MARFVSSASIGFIVWNMEYEVEFVHDEIPSKLHVVHISSRNKVTTLLVVRKLAHHAQDLGLVVANDSAAIDPVNGLYRRALVKQVQADLQYGNESKEKVEHTIGRTKFSLSSLNFFNASSASRAPFTSSATPYVTLLPGPPTPLTGEM